MGKTSTTPVSLPGITTNVAGAVRTSQMTTLFDGKALGAQAQDMMEIAGTGVHVFSENISELSVGPGEYMIIQSKRRMPYFSGKTQVVELTMDSFALEPGIIKRAGYYSSETADPYENYDGFMLVSDGDANDFRLEVWRAGSLKYSASITTPSANYFLEEYDWDNFTVLFFEFLWLGGAALVLWMATKDGFIPIGKIEHVGISPETMIVSPNQRVRYEIRSTTGSGSLSYICSQVSTEGSTEESGKACSMFNPTPVAVDDVNDHYVLLGVRQKSGFEDIATQITGIAVGTEGTADSGVAYLVKGGTISAPLTWSDSDSGRFEVGIPGSEITYTPGTGRRLASIPVSRYGASEPLKQEFLSWLSSNLDGTAEEYYLVYMPVTPNSDVYGIMNLKEY
ncbi:virion structural protein [Rhodobacteraceae phage LS06-2018-MD07]|jgi:hypothetical protein|nr:virion structural protein [Rhodobacteraceae phage LS06-2018-MD07]